MNEIYNIIENSAFWFFGFPYLIFIILVSLMYLSRKEKTHSISRCMAYSKKRYIFFMILFIIGCLPIFSLLAFYLTPKYGNNVISIICCILFYIGEVLLASSPDSSGIKRTIHLIGASLAAIASSLFVLSLVLFGTMDTILQIISIQFVLIAFISILSLLLSKKAREKVFMVEVIFMLDWIITVLILAYK